METQQPYDCFVGAPVLQGRGRTRTTSLHRRAKWSDLSASCYEEAERSDLSRWLMEASCKQAAPETNRYFYHPDHLGSSSFITNGVGTATHHLQYLPFGEAFVEQRIRLQPWYTPYKFSGKEKDEETSLSYFGARYYDSDLSVWLSVDAMSDNTPGVSPFAYCVNNPVIIVDPDGNDWFVDEVTGDVAYYSNLGKNEAKAVGKNYIWLGKNGMLGETVQSFEYFSNNPYSDPWGKLHWHPLIGRAESVSIDLKHTNGGNSSTYTCAYYKGKNAVAMMNAMGYQLVPTQAIEHTTEFQTQAFVGIGRSISFTSYNVTRILEKYTYVPENAYEVNTFDLTQRAYKTTSPYSSQSVARVSINYSTNCNYSNDRTIRNGIRAVGYGIHSDYLIKNFSYASYPKHIDMLNKYILNH